MNDIVKETARSVDTRNQTPIEIALGVDSRGMTTAKKLYAFLELDSSHYAKWFRKNILENAFAEENEDYWVFAPQCENRLGGRPTQDARLTAGFAKKLSMMQKNEKGEAARNYFIGVENGAKKLVKHVSLTDHPGEVARLINAVSPLMRKNDSSPYDIARNAELICKQYGIDLIDNFAKVPSYEQQRLNLMNGNYE